MRFMNSTRTQIETCELTLNFAFFEIQSEPEYGCESSPKLDLALSSKPRPVERKSTTSLVVMVCHCRPILNKATRSLHVAGETH
jgi:hypothetical protein